MGKHHHRIERTVCREGHSCEPQAVAAIHFLQERQNHAYDLQQDQRAGLSSRLGQ